MLCLTCCAVLVPSVCVPPSIDLSLKVREIEASAVECAKQELEGRRLRELAEMQQRCAKDIERARTEERRAAAAEIEKVQLQLPHRRLP